MCSISVFLRNYTTFADNFHAKTQSCSDFLAGIYREKGERGARALLPSPPPLTLAAAAYGSASPRALLGSRLFSDLSHCALGSRSFLITARKNRWHKVCKVSGPMSADESLSTRVDYVGSIFLEILFVFIKPFGVNVAQWKSSTEINSSHAAKCKNRTKK